MPASFILASPEAFCSKRARDAPSLALSASAALRARPTCLYVSIPPTPVTLEQCDAILIGRRSDMEPAETCAAPAVQDFDDVFDEQHHYTYLDPEYAARLRPHLQHPSALASMLR